jgi:hypothetical protein
MVRLIALIVFIFAFIPNVQARFMPDNGLHLQEQLTAPIVNENQFKNILDNFRSNHLGISKNFSYSLIVNGDWSNNQVNAITWRDGRVMFIEVWGGLARRLSTDGINMVLCHEMGHQVGGWPLYTGDTWAAIEGQSDYYAAHVCVKRIFKTIDYRDQADFYRRTGEEAACDERYPDYEDREICYRSMSAGLELARLLAGSGRMPSYSTPDKTEVSKMRESHPPAQCRLDTYRAASLCPSKWRDSYIPRTEKMSARYLCTPAKKTWANASRPRCWFVPSK